MENQDNLSLVIKEHDFQEAKNSLKKYTTKSNDELSLPSVPFEGGLFNLGDHKVTGYELNKVTSRIQEYLIDLNTLNQGLISEFGQVYKAFESLDKDYITGIVGSIKAAEKVRREEQKDRADIKNIINRLDKSVEVLKKFKTDIDNLKHITDVDKAWELISKQEKTINSLQAYKKSLSDLSHLLDADIVWSDVDGLKKEHTDITGKISNIFDLINGINGTIVEIQSILAGQKNKQEEFEKAIKKEIIDFRTSIDKKYIDQSNEIHNVIEKTKTKLDEQFNHLAKQQEKQNLDTQKKQTDELSRISQEHESAIEAMRKAQEESMASVVKTIETEKVSLQETVEMMKQKLKTAYIIAGSAAALAVIHIALDILGVI